MAGHWQGFSDREIESMRQGTTRTGNQVLGRAPKNVRVSSLGDEHRPQAKKSVKPVSAGAARSPTLPIPPDKNKRDLPEKAFFQQSSRKAVSSMATASPQSNPAQKCLETSSTPQPQDTPSEAKTREDHMPIGDALISTSGDVTSQPVTVTDVASRHLQTTSEGVTVVDFANSATTLDQLQKQQKEMEAENKRKKVLLEQTIQERYKKSQTEAKTLQLVKQELDRLEGLVTRDVSILREKIEDANRQYSAARKRYQQTEAEFVAAKMELHRTSEQKELLSEHLCTVIQQNEVRKARKLAELLQALSISPTEPTTREAHLVFQRTPTPGTDIWPRGRMRPYGSPQHESNSAGRASGSNGGSHIGDMDSGSGHSKSMGIIPDCETQMNDSGTEGSRLPSLQAKDSVNAESTVEWPKDQDGSQECEIANNGTNQANTFTHQQNSYDPSNTCL